jgi:hypothetical protein
LFHADSPALTSSHDQNGEYGPPLALLLIAVWNDVVLPPLLSFLSFFAFFTIFSSLQLAPKWPSALRQNTESIGQTLERPPEQEAAAVPFVTQASDFLPFSQLILSVFEVDALGRDVIKGYGCVHLPTAAGRSVELAPLLRSETLECQYIFGTDIKVAHEAF